MRVIGEEETENLYQGWHHSLYDSVHGDSKMRVEKFDDLVAALTLTATVITITLGSLFNL